ncbi:hypothetical protein ACWGRF_08195 [Streptomyces zhihengii]
MLEERGDIEGAIAAYRQAGDDSLRRYQTAGPLADLLARHSRNDEAIDVMRALADAPGGAEDWILHQLCTLYADQGRLEDGLAYLDARTGHPGEVEWQLLWMRLPLMAACGRVDEAYEQVRARPEGGTPYAAPHIAELLAGAGRTEEAVAVLRPHARENRHDLAGYLVDLGRIDEAVAVLQQGAPCPPQSEPVGWNERPPF